MRFQPLPSRYLYYSVAVILFATCCILISATDRQSSQGDDWAHYGHDASNNKFSPLSQINVDNVVGMHQLWSYEDAKGGSNLFFNPLVVSGKMISFMPSNKLVALDAGTGKQIWEFVPDSTDIGNWARGATIQPGANGRPAAILFVFGSILYKIDLATGKLVKGFGNGGKVDFYTGLDVKLEMRSRVQVSTNAPGVIFKDLFIVGCKVPDELPSTSGDIRAFNVNTGKLEWVFHTIPREGEYGYITWPKGARGRNGGANCWGGIALDEKLGIAYVPTASPSFDYYGADREGQNLFANCLLALDARTGKRIWHFQTTHHDLWDRDNGSPPNLVRVKHDGKMVDAVALATKMGYVFMFDRKNGKPLWPIKEVPVPTESEMPGEKPWPTQPFPDGPEPFVRQGFKPEYFSDLTPATTQYIKDQIREKGYSTGIYEPPTLRGSLVVPAAHGGANWGGGSFNPNSGLFFVNAIDMPWFLQLKEIKSLEADNSQSGKALFNMYCSTCHGADRKGTNFGPDITLKIKAYSLERIEGIIKKGAEPMPSFKHLPQQQIDAITAFLKDTTFSTSQPKAQELEAHSEPYSFAGYNFFLDQDGNPAIKPPYGTLSAINLNTGKIAWQVPLGEDPKLAAKGIKNTGLFNRGGGIATAGGLIFIAATTDRTFRAFDQASGRIVWQTELPGHSTGIPSTYSVGGRQYVTIAVSPNPNKNYKGGYITYGIE